jgi:hypothetical protein
MAQATPIGEAAVGHQHVAGMDRKARQTLALTGFGHVDLVAAESAQVQRVVQPPRRARGAGLANAAAVDQAYAFATKQRIARSWLRHARSQFLCHPLKPRPTAAQPLEQRHVRHVGQLARLCTCSGLAQRTPIGKVNEQDAQQRLHAPKTAQPAYRTQLQSLGLPICRQHRCHHAPVLPDARNFARNQLVLRHPIVHIVFKRLVHEKPRRPRSCEAYQH